MVTGHLLAWTACIAGWLGGGHSERFAVMVLLADYAVSSATLYWRIGDFYWAAAVREVVVMALFAWLAIRTDRWWPLAATAAMILVMLVHALTIVTPITQVAAVSAKVGLWMVVDTALLVGVLERWLSGEPAVSGRQVWTRRRLHGA